MTSKLTRPLRGGALDDVAGLRSAARRLRDGLTKLAFARKDVNDSVADLTSPT